VSQGLDATEAVNDGRRPRAAFTIVQNEAFFLPLWLGYYGRYFDAEDLYVLDHDSTDGSTSALGGRCSVVPVHRDHSFDHEWLRATVETFQAFLLTAYEVVLFAEADEFLVADPARHGGLGAYLDALEGPAARATGFNVVHHPREGEPPLATGEPLLAHRGYWHPAPLYSKTLIGRIPLHWSVGFHVESSAAQPDPDPELWLVHLHRGDYDRCLARHRSAVAREWSPEDLERGYGKQSRVVDADEFERWFYAGEDLEGTAREPIPERLREVL
jgi:Glycosyl transferase family 2